VIARLPEQAVTFSSSVSTASFSRRLYHFLRMEWEASDVPEMWVSFNAYFSIKSASRRVYLVPITRHRARWPAARETASQSLPHGRVVP